MVCFFSAFSALGFSGWTGLGKPPPSKCWPGTCLELGTRRHQDSHGVKSRFYPTLLPVEMIIKSRSPASPSSCALKSEEGHWPPNLFQWPLLTRGKKGLQGNEMDLVFPTRGWWKQPRAAFQQWCWLSVEAGWVGWPGPGSSALTSMG